MFKKILVPVDGSPTSTHALEAAVQMARESSGEVRLLHLIDDLPYVAAYESTGLYAAELDKTLREAGTRILADARALTEKAGVRCDVELIDQFGLRLGEAVAEAVKRWGADLVVVGTHGRRGIGRVVMGSGAEQVIRLAPVPVLVMRMP